MERLFGSLQHGAGIRRLNGHKPCRIEPKPHQAGTIGQAIFPLGHGLPHPQKRPRGRKPEGTSQRKARRRRFLPGFERPERMESPALEPAPQSPIEPSQPQFCPRRGGSQRLGAAILADAVYGRPQGGQRGSSRVGHLNVPILFYRFQ